MAKYRVQREIDQYVARTPRSGRLFTRKPVRYLPGGTSRAAHYFDPTPCLRRTRRGGTTSMTSTVTRYLDFGNNATSLILGHAHPEVVESNASGRCRPATPSATPWRRRRGSPDSCASAFPLWTPVRFTNSGTEATLNAIRAARAFTGRHKIAKFEGTYQGAHEYATVSHRIPSDRLDPDGPTVIHDYPGQPPTPAGGRDSAALQQPGGERAHPPGELRRSRMSNHGAGGLGAGTHPPPGRSF